MHSYASVYIRHHLLHKSARKLLEMSEINGLSEIIFRFFEEKCDMTVILLFLSIFCRQTIKRNSIRILFSCLQINYLILIEMNMEAYMDLQLSSCFYFNYTYEVGLMPK